MNPTSILYPGIAMFFLTLGVLAWLGLSRARAIREGSVSIRYFRTYDEGSQPARLHLLARHVQNHFEVPPLFYAAILFTYVGGAVTPWSVALAWLFVLARCAHSVIHLGPNNVRVRFVTFGASLVVLTGLWVTLLVHLLRAAP